MDAEIPLLRPADGRMIAGVCAGLARRWRCDATLVRALAVLLALALGLGVVLYAIAWILIPRE